MASDHVGVLLNSFRVLIVSQISTRLITFLLNLATTRLLTVDTYGVAAIRFHLINTTALFLSREGFRRGCLRSDKEGADAQTTKQTLATSALVFPFGAIITVAVCRIALWDGGQSNPHVQLAILLQGMAALLELMSEPLYILAQVRLQLHLRVWSEAGGTLARGLLTLALLAGSSVPPVIAISLGQVAYAVVVLAVFVGAYAPGLLRQQSAADRANQIPDPPQSGADKAAGTSIHAASSTIHSQPSGGAQRAGGDESRGSGGSGSAAEGASGACPAAGEDQAGQPAPLLRRDTLQLCASFSLQSVVKLVLAEGSKMVMAGRGTARQQGVYGLVSNLGSLVVRTLFLPIEEAAFLAFSRPGGPLPASASLLTLLVRTVVTIGLVAVAFGPPYAYVLLRVAYGSKWTEASQALGLYCLYILMLAANGVLEAHLHAAAQNADLAVSNLALTTFSGIHIALSVAWVGPYGANGLIAADAVNMALRIAYSLVFAHRRFESLPSFRLRGLLPSTGTLLALTASSIAATLSSAFLLEREGQPAFQPFLGFIATLPRDGAVVAWGFPARAALHVATGGICFFVSAAVIYFLERQLLSEIRNLKTHSD